MPKLSERLIRFTIAAHSSARTVVEDADDKGGKTPSVDDVIEFLRKNPNPADDKWHAWAEKSGYNVHKAEAVAYELATKMAAFLSAGKASKAKYDPKTLPKDVLELGMKVEAEHSDDPDTQMRIVGDHASEYMDKDGKVDPEKVRKYYEGIIALEKQIKGE